MKRRLSPGIITAIHGSTIVKTFLSIFALLLFVFSVSGFLTSLKPEYRISSNSVHTVANQFSGKLLFSLLGTENHHFLHALPEQKEKGLLTNQLLKLSTNISLEDPRSLLGRELPGFSIYDNEILVAGEGTNYTNMPYESSPPIDVMNEEREASLQNVDEIKEPEKESKQPAQTTNGRRVVEIYHSHNRESYLPYLKGVTDPDLAYHSKINITKLGARMVDALADNGIGASVDNTDITGQLNKKGINYNKSYQESRKSVQAAMAENKDLEYLIDIHRDSKRKKDTTIAIDGKGYAKLAFIIGGNNPAYEKNAALANNLHKALEKKYPGISRGVIKQGGSAHNGIYNQDLSGNALLIEVGGVDNTFEEMFRTVDAFSDVFSEYFWDAKAVDGTGGQTEAR